MNCKFVGKEKLKLVNVLLLFECSRSKYLFNYIINIFPHFLSFFEYSSPNVYSITFVWTASYSRTTSQCTSFISIKIPLVSCTRMRTFKIVYSWLTADVYYFKLQLHKNRFKYFLTSSRHNISACDFNALIGDRYINSAAWVLCI